MSWLIMGFSVDDKRYLMGHSMGGAGALFLGPKHVDQWAAVASMAPAAFLMVPDTLGPVKDRCRCFWLTAMRTPWFPSTSAAAGLRPQLQDEGLDVWNCLAPITAR